VQSILIKEFKFKQVENVLISPNIHKNKDKLLIINQSIYKLKLGNGNIRPGLWSRNLCFYESLNTGKLIILKKERV
jgi:hypothetical protein